MTTDSIPNHSAIKSKAPAQSPSKLKRWWSAFQRQEKPAAKAPKRSWLPQGRKHLIEEVRTEQKELMRSLESLNQRLESAPTHSAPEIDPMPVVRSIRSIEENQENLSQGLAKISSHMEKAEKTSERILSSITSVDQTLGGVQSSQAKTATAITKVGDQISEVTGRFEALFDKMRSAEEKMATDYRKFQQRTLIAIGSIAISAIVTVAIVLSLPIG